MEAEDGKINKEHMEKQSSALFVHVSLCVWKFLSVVERIQPLLFLSPLLRLQFTMPFSTFG